MQSKRESLIETGLNVGSGFLIAWIMTITVLPLFGLHTTINESFQITLIYTLVSILRGYLWRRYFNNMVKRRVEV
jgi:membrane protein implicated in regulation of membrane protease activity